MPTGCANIPSRPWTRSNRRCSPRRPIYDDLETLLLADSLGMYVEWAGADNPLVGQVLAGKSPQERAAELIRGSKLADVAVRRQLAEGGSEAIASSADPMIQLARLVDKPAREARTSSNETWKNRNAQAYGKIASARFAIYGADNYPDATFTLRLAFGTVAATEKTADIPAVDRFRRLPSKGPRNTRTRSLSTCHKPGSTNDTA